VPCLMLLPLVMLPFISALQGLQHMFAAMKPLARRQESAASPPSLPMRRLLPVAASLVHSSSCLHSNATPVLSCMLLSSPSCRLPARLHWQCKTQAATSTRTLQAVSAVPSQSQPRPKTAHHPDLLTYRLYRRHPAQISAPTSKGLTA
jgi:hypothetical protein